MIKDALPIDIDYKGFGDTNLRARDKGYFETFTVHPL